MFFHVLKYRLKCILKDKQMMFWTLLFPIVLSTFFNMAFSNLNSNYIFEQIPIALVDGENLIENEYIKNVLLSLSDNSDNPLFYLTQEDLFKAKMMLENDEVVAYIVPGKETKVFIKESGISQTVVKSVIDSTIRSKLMVNKIMVKNPKALDEGLGEYLLQNNSFIVKDSHSNTKTPNDTLIYFYALIAMTCFYGAFVGIKEISAIQADLSPEAIRVNVSPVKKLRVYLSSLTASMIVQFGVIIILLLYLSLVLKISFGNELGYVLLLSFTGTLTGVAFGAMIGAFIRGGGEGLKVAILIGITMTLSFLSGMMQSSVKYAVTNALPFMAYINPLNLITDGFYTLYYYPDHSKYFINISVLWIFILIFSFFTITKLRRTRYASI